MSDPGSAGLRDPRSVKTGTRSPEMPDKRADPGIFICRRYCSPVKSVLYYFRHMTEMEADICMARPRRCRRVCAEPDYGSFRPDGIPGGESVTLTVDEYEVIRLIDLEKLTHEQCAKRMDISRTTVTEIYESAREKIADSIVNGRVLLIAGGDYRLCDGSAVRFCRKRCGRASGAYATDTETRTVCSAGHSDEHRYRISEKGENTVRIAVTFENGNIYQHFGHTEQFKIYDAENGQITKEQVADTNGSGHGALAGFLTELGVDTLICGGIGMGAKNALADAGIQLYGGVTGSADEAVKALLEGNLSYNPDIQCSHHGEGHHGEERSRRDTAARTNMAVMETADAIKRGN